MISNRVSTMQASPIRKLVPFADAAKKRGTYVYHLNIGQPDINTPPEIINAIRNFSASIIPYGYSQGEPYLWEAICEYFTHYNLKVAPEQIVVTNGGSEAISFAFSIVADPGQEIIAFEPYYTNYNSYASTNDLKIVPVTTKAENGFALPPTDEIESRITHRTRAILLCSPNNPTGTVYTREEMKRVVDLALKHKLYIISDEVYREFIYDGAGYTSMLSFPEAEERVIVVDSISKRYSACGARVGYLVCKNKEVIGGAMKLAQARLCPPMVEQVGAAAGFRLSFDYFKTVQQEYKRRRDIMYKELKKIPGVVLEMPQGAFYMVVKLPIADSEDFARWLLESFEYEKQTVMVAPAQGFYSTTGMGTDEVRMAYVLECDKLEKAMKVFGEALKVYPGRI